MRKSFSRPHKEDSEAPQPEATLRRRAWLLNLVVLAGRSGLMPLSKRNLHSLVFLANGLAPLYREAALDERVVRHEVGPFYPDVQWDLDRLVGQGLLKMAQVRYVRTEDAWWLEADYLLTQAGMTLSSRLEQLPQLQRSNRFLVELTSAFASVNRDDLDQAAQHDAIYSAPGRAQWASLVFESPDDNYAARTANAFEDVMGDIRLSPKERVRLYFGYLGRVARQSRSVSEVEVSR